MNRETYFRAQKFADKWSSGACREFFRGYHWNIRLRDGQTVGDWSSVGWQSYV